jgi:DNA-binding MarR family transcriptional regulator
MSPSVLPPTWHLVLAELVDPSTGADRERSRDQLLDGFGPSRPRVEAGLDACIRDGLIEMVRGATDGAPVLRLTPRGRAQRALGAAEAEAALDARTLRPLQRPIPTPATQTPWDPKTAAAGDR